MSDVTAEHAIFVELSTALVRVKDRCFVVLEFDAKREQFVAQFEGAEERETMGRGATLREAIANALIGL